MLSKKQRIVRKSYLLYYIKKKKNIEKDILLVKLSVDAYKFLKY